MAPKKIKAMLNSEWYLSGQTHQVSALEKVGNTRDPRQEQTG